MVFVLQVIPTLGLAMTHFVMTNVCEQPYGRGRVSCRSEMTLLVLVVDLSWVAEVVPSMCLFSLFQLSITSLI